MDNWEKNIFQTEGIAVPACAGRLVPPCSKRVHRPELSVSLGLGLKGGDGGGRPERSGLGQPREGLGAK